MTTKRILLSLGIVTAAVATAVAWPSDSGPVRAARIATIDGQSRAYLHSYNIPAHGVAIEGYSPVSYFDSGRAQPGDARYAVEHDGVTYYLASEGQVEAFRRDPGRYVPAFGGWCAFGMAIEDKFPVDPANFKIVDGQLMLFLKNRSVDARELWNDGDEREYTEKAAAHWNRVNG